MAARVRLLMNPRRHRICMSLAGVAVCGLTACAGVPELPEREVGQSRATVTDIIDHISCELLHSDQGLANDHYFVTVLLTLQVDDFADFTPSLSAINPLAGSSTFVASFSGDFGGSRQRTFTTTYTIDAFNLLNGTDKKLKASNGADKKICPDKDAPYRPPKKLYNLSGDLSLAEIVRDGLEAKTRGGGIIDKPTTADGKTAPAFGSKVQFIITQSMTGAGPVWTIRHFKGPGSQNGIVSGKRLDTDSLLIGFAPQYQPTAATPSDVEKAAAAIQADIVKWQQTLSALNDQKQRSEARETQRKQRSRLYTFNLQAQQSDEAARASDLAAADALQNQLNVLQSKLDLDRANQVAAERATSPSSPDAAIAAAHEQITNMLLQGLGALH